MTNLDIFSNPGVFVEVYEKARAVKREEKPVNSSAIPLEEQLKNLAAFSFT